MAGRNLRRQRETALAALSDEQTVELARQQLPKLSLSHVRTLLYCVREDVRPTYLALEGDDRATLSVCLGRDLNLAQAVIHHRCTDPDVEEALGVTRTPAQQRPHRRTRTFDPGLASRAHAYARARHMSARPDLQHRNRKEESK